MFKYEKKLEYPVNITKKNLEMAKYILTGLGGSAGELAAATRYYIQSFSMPDERGKALLIDIATEELAHVEIISTMFRQLVKDATPEELKSYNLGDYYTEHGKGVYPVNASGMPFTATYIQSTGNPVVDLAEDMAAEEKARASYESLIDLTDNPEILNPLLFLRQREVVHYNRFKELYEDYKNKYKL
ncbi:MAG: manganese catalase family protein [Bacilli bacterium]|nr:manganese catalase family protein [Bacilli bacterium]